MKDSKFLLLLTEPRRHLHSVQWSYLDLEALAL